MKHLRASMMCLAFAALTVPGAAQAASLRGDQLSPLWAVPFVGLLLSIALCPLLTPRFWHRHYGKVVAFWACGFVAPLVAREGAAIAAALIGHVFIEEYLPFVILLTALFTISGGIYVRGNLHGSPALNTGFLALGAVLASFMGTTGASMLLVRPLIRANDNRRHRAHVLVFFIFIVANAGGALTPLGDPPLFLGFLKGVDFFWTLQHLHAPMLFLVGALLAVFYAIDRRFYGTPGEVLSRDPTPDTATVRIEGRRNVMLLGAVVALVLVSGVWKPDAALQAFGVPLLLPNLARDAGLVIVTVLSFAWTPRAVHLSNRFSWPPMAEVAKLFAGIFVTIVPVIAMLKAGVDGPFGAVIRSVTRADGSPDPMMYFWAAGLLSSFLDNAPTYLVFFNTAGGNPGHLMTELAGTLAAVSAGAVFMGANTYIGNAPNLMIKAVAEEQGVKMPGFFGYMLWSGLILLPLFALVSVLWMR